jgi:hypothetical protein
MKNVASHVLTGLSNAAARWIARNSAAVVPSDAIRVGIVPDRDGLRLVCRYVLAARSSDRRPVSFDLRSTDLVLLSAKCSRTVPADTAPPSPGAKAFTLNLAPGETWDEAVIELALLWPALSGCEPQTACLVLPDSMPRILEAGGEHFYRQRSRVVLQAPTSLPAVWTGGIVAGDPKFAGGSDLIEALLLRGAPPHDEGGRIMFSANLSASWNARECARALRMCERMLDFLSRVFGLSPDMRILAKTPQEPSGWSDGPSPSASWFNANREMFGLDAAHAGEPNDFYLVVQLARIWWGGGCRIVGKHATDLQGALAFLAGLLWLDYMEEKQQHAQVVHNLKRFRWSWLKSMGDRLRGEANRRRTARAALALYSACASRSASAEDLRALTREAWGQEVSSVVVYRRLCGA